MAETIIMDFEKHRLKQAEEMIKEWNETEKCPDCGAIPGNMHLANCDQERCSACNGQYISCYCEGHIKTLWPGLTKRNQDLEEERQRHS